jgi:hypothetical protein
VPAGTSELSLEAGAVRESNGDVRGLAIAYDALHLVPHEGSIMTMCKLFGLITLIVCFALDSGTPLQAQESAVQPAYQGQPGFGPGEQYYNPNREPLGVNNRPSERIVARPGTPPPTFKPGLGVPSLSSGHAVIGPLIEGR